MPHVEKIPVGSMSAMSKVLSCLMYYKALITAYGNLELFCGSWQSAENQCF